MRLKCLSVTFAWMFLNVGGVAHAQDMKPAEIVDARIDRFRQVGTAFKAINDELKKPRPLKIVLSEAGSTIASTVRENLTLFPKGTGPAPGIKTKAKPEIWTRRKEFDDLFSKLLTESQKMETATNSGDFDAMRAQYKVLGEVCKNCHQTFRTKDD